MCVAIVVAGGTGERFGSVGGKQMALVGGLPVVAHALLALDRADTVEAVVLVCHPGRVDEYRDHAVSASGARKVAQVVAGGATRGESVSRGLAVVPGDAQIVAVHDGARPLIDPACVDAAVATLRERADVDGVVVGHPAYDTIKSVGPSLEVTGTPDRGSLWVAQTPQVFRAGVLRAAHEAAAADDFDGTDDASLVERAGGKVVMLEGSRWNVKVTFAEDLAVVEALLRGRELTGDADG